MVAIKRFMIITNGDEGVIVRGCAVYSYFDMYNSNEVVIISLSCHFEIDNHHHIYATTEMRIPLSREN